MIENKILKHTKSIIFMSILVSHNGMASEEVIIKKYGYGLPLQENIDHDIYPLNDSHITHHLIGDNENDTANFKSGAKINLFVSKDKSALLSLVMIYNKSNQPIFIYKRQLPLDYNPSKTQAFYSKLCGNGYFITTDNIVVNYLGPTCHGESDTESDNWLKISPDTILSFTVKLNDSYAFPLGKHRYNIGTLGYDLVNNAWFIEQAINNSLFSILNWKSDCKIKKFTPLLRNEVEERTAPCDSGYNHKYNIRNFLENLGYRGGDENSFQIRSNQVVIEIDGDAIEQPYKTILNN